MKKLYIYTLILALASLVGACNDEWTDELYTQMVSFKAPVGNQGVAEVYLRYSPNGEVEYNLPVIISGSTENERDLHVAVEVDNDTLAILNREKYQHRTDLFYNQLPAQFFELPSSTVFIPKGSHIENFKVKFKFENLDLVEQWVLPLKIKDDPSYKVNYRKGWRKALLHIKPFNDFSGNYSATAMNVYFDGETTGPTVMSSKTAWVVDETSVFMYAGMIEDNAEDRANYKIILKFEEGVVDGEGITKGNLTVQATNPNINFELLNQPTYEIREVADATLPYLVRRYCKIDIGYKYNDITSTPTMPIRYRAVGSMTMERQNNTLIPDEDQAIQW